MYTPGVKLFEYLLIGTLSCLLLVACEQDKTPSKMLEQPASSSISSSINDLPKTDDLDETSQNEQLPTQFNVGNKSYLFDVSDHTIEELESLLERAEEITQMTTDEYDDIEIVMILHGPDIDWFTQQNYVNNKQLVDLAAKLDAYEIIDMKVCETAMDKLGFKRDDIPSFIESVPYSPDLMKRLLKEGYINL